LIETIFTGYEIIDISIDDLIILNNSLVLFLIELLDELVEQHLDICGWIINSDGNIYDT
jgi:hypothetical protein